MEQQECPGYSVLEVLFGLKHQHTDLIPFCFQIFRAVQVSPDGGTIVAAVYKGFVYISENGGGNWTVQVIFAPRCPHLTSSHTPSLSLTQYFQDKAGIRNWAAVAIATVGSFILLAESDGDLHLSRDHGLSWIPLQIDLDQPFVPASTCSYPYIGKHCSRIHLDIVVPFQLVISIFFGVLFIAVICLRTIVGSVVYISLVALHNATTIYDVLYILTSEFSNSYIFLMSFSVFFFQFLFYSYGLVNFRRSMKLWVVEVPHLLIFKHHETLVKLLLGGLVHLVFFVINLPVILPLYLLGLLLMTTKLFAICELSNYW